MRKLEAPKGYKYTSVKEVDIKDKSFARIVYLAINDSEENWILITDEEVSKIQAQQKELYEKEIH